jgi:hypothetical protein
LRRRRSFRFIHLGQVVAQRGQTHAEDEPLAKAAEQIEIGAGQRTACEDTDVERRLVTDEFERATDEASGVIGQFPLTSRVGMANNLVGICRAAINYRAVAISFELRTRRVLSGAQ